MGALLAPLLIILLLPTFLSSLQTLLAGRALEVSDLKSDLLDGLTERLNSGHTELEVDRLLAQPGTQRTFLLSLLLNNIRAQMQAQLQALIASLTGGPLLGGRQADLTALHERVLTRGGFSNSIFSQLRAQIVAAIQTAIQNFLASLGIGRSLGVASLERQLLVQNIFQNCLAQIQAAIQNFLNAFGLGRTGLSSSIFSALQAQILAAIQTAITNFLNSLGIGGVVAGRNLNLAESDRQILGDLFGNFDTETSLPSSSDDMEAIVNMILAEMGINGGPEEMAQMVESEMAGLLGQMEEMEQLSDEEIVQHVMEMMGGSGNMAGPDVMAMMMAEIEKPADCHCVPTELPHGLLNG